MILQQYLFSIICSNITLFQLVVLFLFRTYFQGSHFYTLSFLAHFFFSWMCQYFIIFLLIPKDQFYSLGSQKCYLFSMKFMFSKTNIFCFMYFMFYSFTPLLLTCLFLWFYLSFSMYLGTLMRGLYRFIVVI